MMMLLTIFFCAFGSLLLQRHISSLFAEELPSHVSSDEITLFKTDFSFRKPSIIFKEAQKKITSRIRSPGMDHEMIVAPLNASKDQEAHNDSADRTNDSEMLKSLDGTSFNLSNNLPQWMKGKNASSILPLFYFVSGN
jgi:flagellar hook-length control protein FliK